MKNVVQDLTSGGKDCFPKYTKQFLNHYYSMNEFFRGESQMKKRAQDKKSVLKATIQGVCDGKRSKPGEWSAEI